MFSSKLKSIKTSAGHRFGMRIRNIPSDIEGIVIGITQCIAGCELLEVQATDDKGVKRTHVFSSKLVEIIDSKKVDEYETIFKNMKVTMPVRLGDEVEDSVADVRGIVGEIQYSVNQPPNVLIVKKFDENDPSKYESARVISCKKTGHSIHDKIIANRNLREKDELKVELMQRARCMATGVEGLVTSKFDQANGTISVGIQPKSSTGKLLDTYFTDIELVEVLEPVKEVKQKTDAPYKRSGCVRSHELTSLQRTNIHV
ncbi:hypothetical protein VPHD479_0285 [Vibrio phage D479]